LNWSTGLLRVEHVKHHEAVLCLRGGMNHEPAEREV
jgi:hypothetical protein